MVLDCKMRAGNHVNLNGGTGGCYTNPEYNGSNTNLNQEISGGLHGSNDFICKCLDET